jgi:formylmethanofuran dehydrogenase subunit E
MMTGEFEKSNYSRIKLYFIKKTSIKYHKNLSNGMKWHPHCRYMGLSKEYSIKELAKFHGHLGPNIVLGYLMGKYACEHLSNDPFSLKATVYCPKKTPESCIVDGIQLGSGCTLGKGNIEIIENESISCEFTTTNACLRLTPKPRPPLPERDDEYELKIEKFAEDIYHSDPEALFEIEK